MVSLMLNINFRCAFLNIKINSFTFGMLFPDELVLLNISLRVVFLHINKLIEGMNMSSYLYGSQYVLRSFGAHLRESV